MRAQTSALLEEDKTTAEFKRERRKVPLTGLLCFCFVSAQAPFINLMSLSQIHYRQDHKYKRLQNNY